MVPGERLQLGRQRAGQARLRADDGRRDVKAAGLHPRVNLCRPVTAAWTVLTAKETLEPFRRYRLQGSQKRCQDPRIPQVRLGAGDTEALSMAIDRFGVDSVDCELLVEQRTHERALRGPERHEEVLRSLDAPSDEGHEALQTLRGILNRPGGQRGSGLVHQTIDVLSISPIDPDQQHWLSPPCGFLRVPCAASPQPSIRTAFKARLPIGGRMPRRPRGEIVSRRRSSREGDLIFSLGAASSTAMIRHTL